MDNQISPDDFCRGVFTAMSSVEDTKPGVVARCLLPLLNTVNRIQPPKPNVNVGIIFQNLTKKKAGNCDLFRYLKEYILCLV